LVKTRERSIKNSILLLVLYSLAFSSFNKDTGYRYLITFPEKRRDVNRFSHRQKE
jgi:hypothetical protein